MVVVGSDTWFIGQESLRWVYPVVLAKDWRNVTISRNMKKLFNLLILFALQVG